MKSYFTLSLFVTLIFAGFTTLAQIPCRDGAADGYPCHKVELLSHLSPRELLAEEHHGVWLNDIWGWTDPASGKEYAIVGMSNGTSFVDISNPFNPVVLGILPEHHAAPQPDARKSKAASPLHDGRKSMWRDMKVYQNHAYIVSEDPGHGVQVFDLTRLREVENPPVVFSETANYQGISNAHNIVINEETGFAFAVGADGGVGTCNEGGLHIIDIREPANPQFAGCFDGDGYTHDAQCVVYRGPDERYIGKEICFSSNEDAISLVDVTDKENPALISSQTYVGVGYAHQGWLTEDQRYFISNDELDEMRTGNNTQSFIWDVRDLENPILIGTYTGPNPSIDHNLYIRDGFVYEANYTSGLQILSLANIEMGELEQVAYFDTYPEDDGVRFEGAWSNYPFFESGVVVVSDITNGLFVLRPRLGLLQEGPVNMVACESGPANFSAVIGEGNFAYQWQLDDGSGFSAVEEGELYSQVNTTELRISAVTEDMQGYRYRIKITDEEGGEHFSEGAFLGVANKEPDARFIYRFEKGGYIFTNETEEPATFVWDFGDGTTARVASPTHWYETAGTYEVTLTATNDCGTDTYTETITVAPTAAAPEINKEIKIYPNPASNTFTIELEENALPLHQVQLISMDGRLLVQKDLKSKGYVSPFQVDVSHLPVGIYYLKLRDAKKMISRKIVVEKE